VYPNLPPTFSVLNVYVAWAAVTTIGVDGFLLLRYRFFAPGLLTIAIYGACGLVGLADYIVADFSAHTREMHASTLLEVVSGSVRVWLTDDPGLHARRVGVLRVERACRRAAPASQPTVVPAQPAAGAVSRCSGEGEAAGKRRRVEHEARCRTIARAATHRIRT